MRVFQACGSSLDGRDKNNNSKRKGDQTWRLFEVAWRRMPKSTPKNHGSILRILLKDLYLKVEIEFPT